MNQRAWRFLCVVLLVSLALGCQKKPTQADIEWQTASRIASLLKLHETLHPDGRVTNLAQLFAALERPYPYSWHQDFKPFGPQAGFENSIYEKYVFPPPGMTNRFLEGEILLLNAQPFKDPEGQLRRIVISKVGEGMSGFRITWREDEIVQKIFADAGEQIPKAVPMLSPPRPSPTEEVFPSTIWDKTADFFDTAATLLGLGADRGRLLQWWTAAFIGAASTLGIVWFLWR
jgi:hypothetical protein